MERAFLISCLNATTNGGPQASEETLDFFSDAAKRDALEKAVRSGKLNTKGRSIALRMLAEAGETPDY